jgi:hypothetical protein
MWTGLGAAEVVGAADVVGAAVVAAVEAEEEVAGVLEAATVLDPVQAASSAPRMAKPDTTAIGRFVRDALITPRR